MEPFQWRGAALTQAWCIMVPVWLLGPWLALRCGDARIRACAACDFLDPGEGMRREMLDP